ncbi:MAG: hypothetical protein K2J71_08365 [Oscillospiraceae bacterium]|nr:hypothetical protein [Oscillospiraceae bacterium]
MNDTENTVVSTAETAGNPGESGSDSGKSQETEKSKKAKVQELTAESVGEMIQAAIANYTNSRNRHDPKQKSLPV